MGLGVRTLRCLVVWATATATLALPARWLLDRADAGAAAFGATSPETSRPDVEQALVGVCAVVLLGCLAWAWLASSAVVVEAMASRPVSMVSSRVAPARLRRVVLALCGTALAGGALHPAYADPGAGHPHPTPVMARIAGLPLPDVVPTAPPQRSSVHDASWVVVAPGDSLWSIAERDLPGGSPASAVVSRWHAIYAANHAAVGPDPDLIRAGTRLRLPRKDSP